MTDPVKIYRPKNKQTNSELPTDTESVLTQRRAEIDQKIADMPTEYGGRPADKGLEPTRYDDWEFKGRCIDF